MQEGAAQEEVKKALDKSRGKYFENSSFWARALAEKQMRT